MENTKQRRLEQAGWRVGGAADFLGLTPEDAALMEIRAGLSQALKHRRQARMTQAELAARLGLSQLRVARAERGARSISIDLLIRALLATGAGPKDVAQAIAASAKASKRTLPKA